MNSARMQARHFLENETQFHLGALPTEQAHPKTAGLGEVLQADVAGGIRLLQSVDRDVPAAAERAFGTDGFSALVRTLAETLASGGRICFSGCGATGRLSILLESCWRQACARLAGAPASEFADRVCSIMTGGDYALVRSVENFEDFMAFGRRQVEEADLGAGDTLVAISEGGETSSVIGTLRAGIERGAKVFFVFNNPSGILAEHVERSRGVIEHPGVVKLDLHSGPMAVAGSTRMQATTMELLVVGAALESAFAEILRARGRAGCRSVRTPRETVQVFGELLDDLEADAAVQALADWVRFEVDTYRAGGLVTYFADACLLDVFTDTTERSPTFMLPPFRTCDDRVSPPAWAFVNNPRLPTAKAWVRVLGREPRCLAWGGGVYRDLGAPRRLQENPPALDRSEMFKFRIGNEVDPVRYASPRSAAILIADSREWGCSLSEKRGGLDSAFAAVSEPFARRIRVVIGPEKEGGIEEGRGFHVSCRLPESPLGLWDRLALKLVLNTLSTATMGCMGRLLGNWMAHVQPSNKKLVDRGTRLVAELAGIDYAQACTALHETIEEQARTRQPGEEQESPVARTIARLRGKP